MSRGTAASNFSHGQNICRCLLSQVLGRPVLGLSLEGPVFDLDSCDLDCTSLATTNEFGKHDRPKTVRQRPQPSSKATVHLRLGSIEDVRWLLLQWVLNAVECQLLTTVGTRFNAIKDQLWRTVDEAITLQDCVIYRYAGTTTGTLGPLQVH